MANISKDKAIELFYIEIEKGTRYTEVITKLLPKFSLSKPTFLSYWREAKANYKKRLQKTETAVIKNEATKIIHALETKEGQVLSLIRQIDDLENDLANNQVTDARWVQDELVHDKRPMLDKEKVEKVALIAKLKADIRKILGLDAVKNHNVNINADINALLMAGDLTPEDSKEDTGKDLKQIEG